MIGTTESLQNSFDPAQAYDYLGSQVVFNTAETLVTYAPDATEPSPMLAAALPEVSADGLDLHVRARAGVKFADGTPFNAAAVKFSLERARDFGAKDAEAAGFLLSGIRSIEAPSDDKVVISLSQPNVTFLSRLAYSVASIVSPTAYADHVLAGNEDGPAVTAKYKTDTIVGTGPYRIVAYKERESIDLEANPDYWGTKPKTKRIRMRLFDKSSALKLALQNNEVDIAFRSLQPDENTFFKDRPGFKLIEGKGSGHPLPRHQRRPPSRGTTSTCAGPWPPPSTARPSSTRCSRGRPRRWRRWCRDTFETSRAEVGAALRRQRPGADDGEQGRAGADGQDPGRQVPVGGRQVERARCRSTSGTARPTTATPRRPWPR